MSDQCVTFTAYPGIEPRMITGTAAEPEDLDAYRRAGGYAPLTDTDQLLDDVDRAGVRGRGGAAFPIARKITAVRGADGVVVANGEEGEPASIKDRWLLRHRPHLVLDGLRLAGQMAGSSRLHVYVSDQVSASSIEHAIDELTSLPDSQSWASRVGVTVVEPAYVAGEETAVVQALNGGKAVPTDKPPRPFEAGVDGLPTLVSNVETLANLPIVQRLGHAEYGSEGTEGCPGTFLLTLTGRRSAGLYEVPYGLTLRAVLDWLDEDASEVGGLMMGGYFSGIASVDILDVPLDYDAMRSVGSGLGCGAVGVLASDSCPVAVSAELMAYFARENAGQCGSCFNGTAAMSAVLGALTDHQAEASDVERLRHWSTFLPGRGACGTLDGASNVAASLLRNFPLAIDAHIEGRCDTCAAGDRPTVPPFAIAYAAPQEVPS